MNLPELNANLNNIQALSDKPNEMDGLTSNELNEKFDMAGNTIKTYINGTLIPSIETGTVSEITSRTSSFVSTSDSRLSNSRQCNNNFDSSLTARNNLKIKTGTSLPGTVEEDCLFFLYS